MAYLNVDLDYFDHPQTLRLIGLLGRGAEVLPIRLWAYCGKFHAEKGELAGLAGQEIEAVLKWWGKSGDALAALVKTEYLEQLADGSYVAAHWSRHQGHIWALKVRGRANAAKRWGEYASSNADSNASSSPGSNASRNAPAVPASKRKGAGGAGTADAPTYGVPAPKYCQRCKVGQVFDSALYCPPCSLCDACHEPAALLGRTANGWVCSRCGPGTPPPKGTP